MLNAPSIEFSEAATRACARAAETIMETRRYAHSDAREGDYTTSNTFQPANSAFCQAKKALANFLRRLRAKRKRIEAPSRDLRG